MIKILSLVILTLTASLLLPVTVQAEETAAGVAVDNTEKNVRDQNDATLTPEDQKETKADINITAKIRKAVIRKKALSMDAHNAKIITRNGIVTLRGPVATQAESTELQKIASKTRGVKRVDNQLEIKAP